MISFYLSLPIQGFAEELYEDLGSLGLDVQICSLKEFEPEDQLVDEVCIRKWEISQSQNLFESDGVLAR